MDPYLERPRFWRGFHNGLVFATQAALNAVLPAGFAANYEERVLILPPERPVYPDVIAVERPSDASVRAGAGGIAVLEASAPHGVLIAHPEEVHEGFIEIRAADDWERIVTIIEFLSPTNKAAGSEGREEYLQKQKEVLESDTHLLEIDLLRGGLHTVSAPLEGLRQRGRWDYLVCLHRSTRRYHYEYWFNTIREPLPPVRVPLTGDFPDVALDLQAIFNQAYDAGPYRRMVDYRQEPPIPLEGEDAAWMDARLREKGLRP